jgi:hypothetical protein
MRAFTLTIYLLSANSLYGQVDSLTINFLNDILTRDTVTGLIVYTQLEGPSYLGPNVELKRKAGRAGNNKGQISLTNKEYKFIKRQWKSYKGFIWPDSLLNNSLRIEQDSVYNYLSADKKRNVYQFSKPIFIRNNSIALIHLTTLCCGQIYGSDHLVYFRKDNYGWKKWIFIREGYY